jgi:hypothetical protein
MERYRDPGTTLRPLAGEVLAVCPACAGCVRVTPLRGTCTACSWTRDATGDTTVWGDVVDPYLMLPLWLTTPVAGHILWALNAAHLDLVEAYVAAGLRERGLDHPGSSLLATLPAWLKSAKHRDEVLVGAARLRARLAEAGA